ncbi:ABC transporter permease [Paenibacillus sp. V4I7]|uniref:ABC transporter permease n=1 Tax=Paenibacillus sp. V4I7 TaxID=3042307 RepID=UPI0027852C7C|nr:ABC transporter permease [Paenibacillus sp. V4I7]MDQ0899020.1 ABC-2 type transport system permease protein [Paenibacillus sp. V4I7]
MNNLIQSEWYKLRMDPSFRTLILIIVSLSLFWPLFQYFDHIADGETQATGIEMFMDAISGNPNIFKIALCVLAGFFISSEYSTGVMKSIASSGNRRGRIFTAKLLVFSLGTVILALIFPVINMTVSTLFSGFGELPGEAGFIYVIRTIGLTILCVTALASIATLFATLMAESGKTIAITIVLFLSIDLLFGIVGQYIPFIRNLYEYTVFKQLYDVGTVAPEGGQLLRMIGVPVMTFACFGFIGAWAYRRKEIK